MDVCSLEDDEYGDMFITQKANNIVPSVPSFDNENEMGTDDGDVIEIGSCNAPYYSDFSKTEDSQQKAVARWMTVMIN